MPRELILLVGSATAIAGVHTVLGPDHYLPFVALAKARGWSSRRTVVVTALCGLGHVASSVVIGFAGIAAGLGLGRLERVESSRGQIAAWVLVAFGLVYGTWGLVRALRGRRHRHPHLHEDGVLRTHAHTHHTGHAHPHDAERGRLTPWVLFILFVLGPCEPLIPLLIYPAATMGMGAVTLVAAVFGVVTIATMIGVVMVSLLGLSFRPTERIGRFAHALAGATLFLCGIAIHLGL